jgi:hypothetical protein
VARPAHQTTTRHLGAAYPFAADDGPATAGVLIGRDLCGGPFLYDPFVLYRHGILSNPNMVVFGQIGRGKSALVKTYLWRQSAFGRRAWVIDPKGEYGPLARAWDVEPVTLRPGGAHRLNPLDAPLVVDDNEELSRWRAELLGAVAGASLGRPLDPLERTALDLAVAEASSRATHPTLPLVVEVLLAPSAASARAVRTDVGRLAAQSQAVALELRRLVAGDLRGMFDGPTSPGLDLGGPAVVLDLSSVYHSPALGVLMTCATAWLQAALRADKDVRGTLLVVDEAWAILRSVAVARWLQSSWKLSRAFGVANMAVLHRVSDLAAAGRDGSEQAHLSQGLLADSETRVVYAQPPGECAVAASLLGLSDTELELVPRLGRGVALWKVGGRSLLVRHRLSADETSLVDTDDRMSAGVAAVTGR